VEPWEPNVTSLPDPLHPKWKALVAADTPIPTPWPKEAYESSARESRNQIRQLRAEHRPAAEVAGAQRRARENQEHLLAEGPYAERVGAFEGAMYETKGYYRPQQRCIMISGPEFCAVCRHAIEEIIDLYAPATRRAPERPVR
jgi:hypothetical protein